MTYRILRRAWGKYTEVESGIDGWTAATLRAMDLDAKNHDGEYIVRSDGEPDDGYPKENNGYQSPMDWL